MQLIDQMLSGRANFLVELVCEPRWIPSQFVQDKKGKVGIADEKIYVSGGYQANLFREKSTVIGEIHGYASDEFSEIVEHDNVEQFLFAAIVVIEQGQVDTGFFGDVAGADGGEAFPGEQLFS